METTKPSLELLRSLSDEHVLRTLMRERRATRAEIAAATGLSKPTISESVKRLSASGAVVDTGERTTGRGRVGTYYALPASGRALVASLASTGVVAEAVDVYGEIVARATAPGADELHGAAQEVADGPFRLAVVSAADPVDRHTGRLVALPDAPLELGALDVPAALAPLVDGPITVDNDVNWAARAEPLRDFAYLFLGEGLGCAVVSDGEVRRGHTGVAGEIAHVVTVGPDGAAMRFTDVFGALGLRRARSTAIDVPKLLASDAHETLAGAVAGVLSAIVALADPEVVVVGGPWGRAWLEPIAHAFAQAPRHVPLRPATVGDELVAARATALEQLRDAVVSAATQR
ncbi:ROK family transcriptional regulator [Solirubrobacter sp. CPCC 204708]|uniref:ROK family transcriptional regulator n=1 Tax=Solirubrobacter deserti TaxID=2282478 RepID=A0ABT4RJX0_9ACTN|nr:ROK family transcriptional regulator [Solirubrobacter deserti]MBE2315836.1 ROK family transcriptional regulator [Solirubrobacter deserti]MDA0138828.1 ROK family transcriptional regulator [Solirubrobacter deserti]